MMTDQDEMLFGAHEGKRMEDVPARYLLWLWDEHLYDYQRDPESPRGQVRSYIIANFHALETECPDFIVAHKP